MYQYPIFLPQVSNREDLLLTVSLFDDDTGLPIDFSGATRAIPGNYTNNLWMVTDGPIITISNTVLSIPDYPIGNQLQPVTLTVDPNLPIVPGDPVSIASLPQGTAIVGPFGPPPSPYITEGSGQTPYVTETSQLAMPPSNLVPGPNTMTGYVTSYTAATGVLVVQCGSSFQFEIRALKPLMEDRDGYGQWFDFGIAPPDFGPLISASLGNGLQIVDIGILQIRVPESTLRRLSHRSYSASLTMTDTVDTRQVFVARLPMQYGGVTT